MIHLNVSESGGYLLCLHFDELLLTMVVNISQPLKQNTSYSFINFKSDHLYLQCKK